MAPVTFRFKSCGHEDKDPMTQALWAKLQERKALPGKLTVESSLPCPPCSRSYEAYYTDLSAWLHAACRNTNTDDCIGMLLLAELVWVRSSLEQQQHPEPPEAKRICALLALAAGRFRERHVDRLEAVLVGEYARGRNTLNQYLADDGATTSTTTEPELNAFFVSQAEQYSRIARVVDMVAATHAYLCPNDPPYLPPVEVSAYFRRRMDRDTAGLEAQSDDLVEKATRLAESLPLRRPRDGGGGGRRPVIDRGDVQVQLIKGMEGVVDDIVGRVGALRELVARAETSPHHLRQEDGAAEFEVAPRKIFGLFF
ncbi:hypothetical protein PG991_007596 [Apiospora marii]|uniref:Uncharacterized protein n=1 Tax=Apiospora marii TaxID=335849 RepID=A0ABR1RTW6_9PEZI